ncbi:hypothetical protein [Sorangium sp. So ce406]|uniref:hypothetical protein n=1 Tax=Sorangium sp. So ce406 TaxID=3133311 RepID=UPI003F5BC6CA
MKLSISQVGFSISAVGSTGPLLVESPARDEVVRSAGTRRRAAAGSARTATPRKRAAARRTEERASKALRAAR